MRLIVLVRDGVINANATGSTPLADEWQARPGTLEAIAKLSQHDFRIAILCLRPVTGWHNDTGLEALNAINEKMYQQLARLGGHVDGLFFDTLTHATETTTPMLRYDMLSEVSTRFGVNIDDLTVIVNREQDLKAINKAGAHAILIDSVARSTDCETFTHLADAIDFLIKET